ncbi:hypothetical protein PENSPDRAFT_753434 [Peniophora sp. CONT]|nr:hypothetical protein PENSPDRAFT_753434 [Peniophora sp. CONT]
MSASRWMTAPAVRRSTSESPSDWSGGELQHIASEPYSVFENPSDYPRYLSKRGRSFFLRYCEPPNELDDLQCAIDAQQRAIDLTRDDHSGKPSRLGRLGIYLRIRFERVGNIKDLERAIAAERGATNLTPDGHRDRPKRLGNLGSSLQARYERLGQLDDLESAIYNKQLALDLCRHSESRFNYPDRLTSLANSLHSRYRHLGRLDDLQRAIDTNQLALADVAPNDLPNRSLCLANLAFYLHARYECLGQREDLEQAIAKNNLALELTNENQPEWSWRLANHAFYRHTRYECLRRPEDLQDAVALNECALGPIAHEQHYDGARRLTNLATSLLARYVRCGQLDDLYRAIAENARALTPKLTPENHPERPRRLYSFGLSLKTLFERHQTKRHFDDAFECFMKAATQPLGSPLYRLDSAKACVMLLSEYHEFGSAELLLDAHSRIIQIFPEIVWFGHSIQRRFKESAKLGDTINAAVSAFIKSRSRYQAIDLLEFGRSQIWSQLSSLRQPTNDLAAQHPELAEALQEASQELQQSGSLSETTTRELQYTAVEGEPRAMTAQPGDINQAVLGGATANTAEDKHRSLAIRYEGILRKIRAEDGFKDFLRTPSITSRMTSIKGLDGPVVFINVHSSFCDALALHPNGAIRHIKLRNLDQDRAKELHSAWTKFLLLPGLRTRGVVRPERLNFDDDDVNSLSFVLQELWIRIVHPVLDALGFIRRVPHESHRLPHVTWCPTGPLTQLPLHAAGIYDRTQYHRPRTFEFVVSSYTPSLFTLLHCLQQPCAPEPHPSLLVIAQQNVPGFDELSYTSTECKHLREVMHNHRRKFLVGEDGTVTNALAAIDKHPWIHFACHGKQDTADPTQSSFALHDGPLTLSMLMSSKVADNAELAFLSACQTATGDENIPEESAHLAAGMLAVGFKGVVATMWSIADADAPIVVKAYYRRLRKLRMPRNAGVVAEGYTGGAYALHKAVKVLRDYDEQNFLRWAPFVHYGV